MSHSRPSGQERMQAATPCEGQCSAGGGAGKPPAAPSPSRTSQRGLMLSMLFLAELITLAEVWISTRRDRLKSANCQVGRRAGGWVDCGQRQAWRSRIRGDGKIQRPTSARYKGWTAPQEAGMHACRGKSEWRTLPQACTWHFQLSETRMLGLFRSRCSTGGLCRCKYSCGGQEALVKGRGGGAR